MQRASGGGLGDNPGFDLGVWAAIQAAWEQSCLNLHYWPMHKFVKNRSCEKWLQVKQGNGTSWIYANDWKPPQTHPGIEIMEPPFGRMPCLSTNIKEHPLFNINPQEGK